MKQKEKDTQSTTQTDDGKAECKQHSCQSSTQVSGLGEVEVLGSRLLVLQVEKN